jgi:hypothetical protein
MLISKGFPAIKGINYCTYYYVPCQEHLALPHSVTFVTYFIVGDRSSSLIGLITNDSYSHISLFDYIMCSDCCIQNKFGQFIQSLSAVIYLPKRCPSLDFRINIRIDLYTTVLLMVSADCCVWSSVTTRIDSSFSSETPDCEATDATLESINF